MSKGLFHFRHTISEVRLFATFGDFTVFSGKCSLLCLTTVS